MGNITLRNAIEEYRASVDKLQSPGRVASPGEEKRRALKAALDAREERMNEIRRPANGGDKGDIENGGDAGGESVDSIRIHVCFFCCLYLTD